MYGPAPIGSWSSDGSASRASSHAGEPTMPTCSAKKNGKFAFGELPVRRNVRSSMRSMGLVASNAGRKTNDTSGSPRNASRFRITASELSGVPSLNWIPSRNVTSQVEKSSAGVHDSVKLLCHWPSASTTTKVSKIAVPSRTGARLNGVFVGFNDPASVWRAIRIVPPAWTASTSSALATSLPSAFSSAPGTTAASESSASVSASSTAAALPPSPSEEPPPHAVANSANPMKIVSKRTRRDTDTGSSPKTDSSRPHPPEPKRSVVTWETIAAVVTEGEARAATNRCRTCRLTSRPLLAA